MDETNNTKNLFVTMFIYFVTYHWEIKATIIIYIIYVCILYGIWQGEAVGPIASNTTIMKVNAVLISRYWILLKIQ